VRLQELRNLKLTDMWRTGVQFASSDGGAEVGEAVLDLSGDRPVLLVQCWTLKTVTLSLVTSTHTHTDTY
jgi:hypothetical protein